MSVDYQPNRRRWELMYDCATAQNRYLYTVVQNGKEATATAVTIQIDNPAGTSVLAAADMTQDTGTDAQWYYDIDTDDTDDFPLDEGYKATITYTISSVDYIDTVYLDVCRHPLHFTTTDDDLIAAENELRNYKLSGETDWSAKIRRAEDKIRGRLRMKANQDGFARPALVVGFDQLQELHILWAIELIAQDQRDYKMRDDYREQRKDELESALASLTYSADDADNPDVEDSDNFATVWSTR